MSTTPFPVGGRDIIERMAAKFPELFVNVDEKQRELTRKLNEQFAFTYGAQWGGKKRAGVPDSSQSKDSMAVLESDGTISIWDMFQGTEPPKILVQDGQAPTFPNDSQANSAFMAMTPTNWLEDAQPGPGPVEPEPPDAELEARVAKLEDVALLQQSRLNDLQAMVSSQADQIRSLTARVGKLEGAQAKPFKVVGKTEATWGHQHIVNLEVSQG